MVDSISNVPSSVSLQRAQTAASTALRNNNVGTTTIIQAQRASNATAPITTALAVPQSAKTGGSGNVKVPRGSLVDVLA
ncbi:MAG: hypothetical protein KGI37_08530 [Alphaproteobacteria bacterium]|nr:hypothetical protein [Alphaproteobacteria bacterium]